MINFLKISSLIIISIFEIENGISRIPWHLVVQGAKTPETAEYANFSFDSDSSIFFLLRTDDKYN